MNPISSTLINKYKISRRGRKLQVSDDSRTLVALPKDVPERTWAEILQKEENDLMIFDIREEIVEDAVKIVYEKYMDRQTALFTAHCAAQAWLKLINWQFYRHDPGEEAGARPACHIPRRAESWGAGAPPPPAPPDAWARRRLPLLERAPDEPLRRWPSADSLDTPLVDDIPQEYWFPGKVCLPRDEDSGVYERVDSVSSYKQSVAQESSGASQLAADSELLQRVTDYSGTDLSRQESTWSSPERGGAGDAPPAPPAPAAPPAPPRRLHDKSKSFSRHSMTGRSRGQLAAPAPDSRSGLSLVSDCRLRNLRLDTQYEVSSEKVDTPPGEVVKRK